MKDYEHFTKLVSYLIREAKNYHLKADGEIPLDESITIINNVNYIIKCIEEK